jgi:hypothetical protein
MELILEISAPNTALLRNSVAGRHSWQIALAEVICRIAVRVRIPSTPTVAHVDRVPLLGAAASPAPPRCPLSAQWPHAARGSRSPAC